MPQSWRHEIKKYEDITECTHWKAIMRTHARVVSRVGSLPALLLICKPSAGSISSTITTTQITGTQILTQKSRSQQASIEGLHKPQAAPQLPHHHWTTHPHPHGSGASLSPSSTPATPPALLLFSLLPVAPAPLPMPARGEPALGLLDRARGKRGEPGAAPFCARGEPGATPRGEPEACSVWWWSWLWLAVLNAPLQALL